MVESVIQNVRFDEKGLIATVVQNAATGEMIALIHLDNSALLKTLKSGQVDFTSRAESSLKNKQYRLVDVQVSRDGDSLTVLVEGDGGEIKKNSEAVSAPDASPDQMSNRSVVSLVDLGSMEFGLVIDDLYKLITDRKQKRPEGSYTSYLFNSGVDKILKKIAEESGEVIIASKNNSSSELISELSDLFYHLLVLMVEREITPHDVREELVRRRAHK